MKPRALILRAAGTNCDRETAHAFELAGAKSKILHVNRLLQRPTLLQEHQLLAIPGGFSYGDDIAAGRILANQIVHHLHDALHEFVIAGKPVIGICNGFQVLIKTGLLPGPLPNSRRSAQTCTLTNNDSGRFVDCWVNVSSKSSKCVWTAGLEPMALPVAHGEGKFAPADDQVRKELWASDQVALTYSRSDGTAANGKFPDNPNGSVDDIAGICDGTGLVFGLMPHPERHVSPLQSPGWTSALFGSNAQNLTGSAPGLAVFRRAVGFVLNHSFTEV